MADQDVITPLEPTGELPAVRSIRPADLKDVLVKGLDDFSAMPTHVVFLSLIYPIVGLALGRATFGYDIIPLLYPLAAGFALIGPFAAIGLYELSRRREVGLDTSWKHAFDIVHSPSFGAIVTLGLLLMVILGVWLAVAHAIYVANFGYQEPTSLTTFAHKVLTTPEGHNLIIVGNAVGFLFAVLAFSLSVVSFPLLLDRHVGVMAAVLTSVRAVLRNPMTMALWGLIVAVGLVIGSLPFFVGLAIVMPVLGHAAWHLYRKVVEPDPSPRPEYRPRPLKPRRYAADFPAALFPWAGATAVESATMIHVQRPEPGRFSPSSRAEVPAYKPVLDNERVRGWRLMIEPGESVPAITQETPGVRIVLNGGDIVEGEPGHPDHDMNLKLGDFIWQEPGAIRAVRNTGATRVEFVEFELK